MNNTIQLLTGASAFSEVQSVIGDLGNRMYGSVEVTFSGAANGTLTLYGTNTFDRAKGKLIANSSQVVGRGEGHLWDLQGVGFRYVFAKWVPILVTGKNWTYAVVVSGATFASGGTGPYTVNVTSVAHGLVTGDYVGIENGSDPAVDGYYQVTKLTNDTFSIQVANDPGAVGTLDYSKGGFPVTIVSATHGLLTGDKVTLYGASAAGVNGECVISKTDANTFVAYSTTKPAAANGTVSYGPGTTDTVTVEFFAKE